MDPKIKVTRIKNKWHARLAYEEKIFDEMACECLEDVGYICREMLRWDDKLGGESKYASASRHRNKQTIPIGKIWYRKDLERK